jgi:hypothetical protein
VLLPPRCAVPGRAVARIGQSAAADDGARHTTDRRDCAQPSDQAISASPHWTVFAKAVLFGARWASCPWELAEVTGAFATAGKAAEWRRSGGGDA